MMGDKIYSHGQVLHIKATGPSRWSSFTLEELTFLRNGLLEEIDDYTPRSPNWNRIHDLYEELKVYLYERSNTDATITGSLQSDSG